MNRVLKFNTASQRIGLTSDLHLNHAKEFLWQGRGFNSVVEHNAAVIATLQPFDVIIHAGDMFLNATEDDVAAILAQIPGTIYTLWGNHPNPLWKIYNREVAAKFGEGFEVYPFKWKNVVFRRQDLVLYARGRLAAVVSIQISPLNL